MTVGGVVPGRRRRLRFRPGSPTSTGVTSEASQLDRLLGVARSLQHEEYHRALAITAEVESEALAVGDRSLGIRARALRGTVLLWRGELADACALAATLDASSPGHTATDVATSAFRSQLAFYLGSYRDALAFASAAIAVADTGGTQALRLLARRETCIVLGNLNAPCLAAVIDERIELASQLGDLWEEAIARNDRACFQIEQGDTSAADVELAHAVELAATISEPTLVLSATLNMTRAQLLTVQRRYSDAAERALETLGILTAAPTAHPYLLGMASQMAVQSLADVGRIDEASAEGHRAVERLGSLLPLTRSAILASLASALRLAGRAEAAFDALSASVALERDAASQFVALQHDLSEAIDAQAAARAEVSAARADADRDYLTGTFNRRYLSRLAIDCLRIGVVVIDIDAFKVVNDTHGHDTGDQVLAQIGAILTRASREQDVVVRLGGDEFAVIVPDADDHLARAIAYRIHIAITSEPWGGIAFGLTIDASSGYASGDSSLPLDRLIEIADGYLYTAKRAGRGRVEGRLRLAG